VLTLSVKESHLASGLLQHHRGVWPTQRCQSFQLVQVHEKNGCVSPFMRAVHARSGSADAHFGQSTLSILALVCIVDHTACASASFHLLYQCVVDGWACKPLLAETVSFGAEVDRGASTSNG
jgi:hypothetical protein